MFRAISYINLSMLLIVSICHIILSIVYRGECPASPYLSIILIVTGITGVLLSIIALILHYFDVYDGSNQWNLLLTYILFIYLIGSRIVTSILAFRLASRPLNRYQCASVIYWTSTLLIIVSYSIIILTCCVLVNLILLQRKHKKYQKTIITIEL